MTKTQYCVIVYTTPNGVVNFYFVKHRLVFGKDNIMQAILHGEYLDTFKGKDKNGKPYVWSTLYSNGDMVRLYGVDLSVHDKFTPIDIPVNIYGKELSVRALKD